MSKNTKKPYYFGQELTVWDSPDTMLLSQWGMLNYGKWCEKESRRMNILGNHACVKSDNGLVCIWREKELDK